MITMTITQNKIEQIISEQLKFSASKQVNWQQQTLGDLGADSLDLVELVIKLEDAFKREIDDQAISLNSKLVDIQTCLSL